MTATVGLLCIALAVVLQAGFLLRRENRRDPVSTGCSRPPRSFSLSPLPSGA